MIWLHLIIAVLLWLTSIAAVTCFYAYKERWLGRLMAHDQVQNTLSLLGALACVITSTRLGILLWEVL
jgi:formate-dependent nitrite reductase membrane component NrfD